MPEILSHERMAVPLAISEASSQLSTGDDPIMMERLSSDAERHRVTPIAGRSTLKIDGQVLVMALGRPLKDCNIFNDLGDKFVNAVLASDRIDETFDRYRETSIKCATRENHSRDHAPPI